MDKEKTKASDMSKYEKVFTYNANVKKRLIKWREDFEDKHCSNLNYSVISQKMEKDFGLTTSPQKIRAIFGNKMESVSNQELSVQEVVALAKILDISLLNIFEYNYNKHVRQKLKMWKDVFEEANHGATLNYSAIAKKMEDDFGIATSAQKISAMFESEDEPTASRSLKLQEIAVLAQLFNIPLLDICEYPYTFVSDMELPTLIKQTKEQRSSIKPLNNDFYSGRYHCYYFRPKHYQDRLKPVEESEIEEAILDISIENGHSDITLKEMKTSTTFKGEKMPSFTLTGKLHYFENQDMAYSFITDKLGRRAMALMFKYINLSADIRYYMTAAMMTFSSNQTHNPLFQKMAVFREPQDYKNTETAETIRGILALNTSPIIIDEDTLKELTANDEVLKKLVSPGKALKTCYVFSEAAIRSNSYFISDENEKVQKILQLRKNSLLPAHELVSEEDYFADFIKEYQIKNRKVIDDER